MKTLSQKEKLASNFLSAICNQRRNSYLKLLNKTNHEELLYFFRKNIRNSQLFVLTLKGLPVGYNIHQKKETEIKAFTLLNREIDKVIYNDIIKILNFAEKIEDAMISAYESIIDRGLPESFDEEINEQLLEFINSYADIITFKLQVFNKFRLVSN